MAKFLALSILRAAEPGAEHGTNTGAPAQDPVLAPVLTDGQITQKFNFKSRKITDESGKEIGRTKKQDAITVVLPVPTSEEIIGFLQAPESAVSKLIRGAVNQIVIDSTRDQFDDLLETIGDEDKALNINDLDFSKLSLEYIASLPPSQRGGVALTEEDFNIFFADYLTVMVLATGKEEKKIKNQIELFKKPTKVRANKDVLNVLVQQLDLYMSQSEALEETGVVADRLRNKFDKWAKEPEKKIDLDLL